MYSFAQRKDTTVVDEPFYGYYLKRTGAPHPGAAEVIAAMECDGQAVIDQTILGPVATDILFVKTMAHHLDGLDTAFLNETHNVLLTRDPAEMLPSLVNQIPNPTARDTALPQQLDLLNLLATYGQVPVVVDSKELLLSPEHVLEELCRVLDIPFHSGMLSWPAGRRDFDGVWAPHWYHNVHKSTGFAPYSPKTEAVPQHVRSVLEECRPAYDHLYSLSIKAPT